MNNWACDAPYDEEANYNYRLVVSEDIIYQHYADGVRDRDQVIDDWIIVMYAYPTDMPPGEYVSKLSRT